MIRLIRAVGSAALLRKAIRLGRSTLVQRGLTVAGKAALESVSRAAAKQFSQHFVVGDPATVYVRGSGCDVDVYRGGTNRVELQASLTAAFGLDFVTEQDEAGVYIVVRRKPMLGTVSQARFTLIAPAAVHLVFHLTPGTVVLHNLDGELTVQGRPS